MKSIFFPLALFLSLTAVGQTINDTIYYTADWKRTTYPKVIKIYGIKDYDENGVGMATYYWKDGTLHSHQMEKNDLKHGICIWYYANGVKKTEANYVEDAADGEMKLFDENGLIKEIWTYDKGKKLSVKTINPETGEEKFIEERPVSFPDVEAQFPGGTMAMQKYISENINYPQASLEKNDQGRVYISFIVNTDGSLDSVTVVRGATKELNEEAVRLITNMPKWIPGSEKGQTVRSRCRLPIVFTLENDSKKKKKR